MFLCFFLNLQINVFIIYALIIFVVTQCRRTFSSLGLEDRSDVQRRLLIFLCQIDIEIWPVLQAC